MAVLCRGLDLCCRREEDSSAPFYWAGTASWLDTLVLRWHEQSETAYNVQENLKHTLPSDSLFELLQESSIDLRIGYQAQQLEWLSLQRTFEADFPPEIEDRPATFSSLPVSCCSCLLGVEIIRASSRLDFAGAMH